PISIRRDYASIDLEWAPPRRQKEQICYEFRRLFGAHPCHGFCNGHDEQVQRQNTLLSINDVEHLDPAHDVSGTWSFKGHDRTEKLRVLVTLFDDLYVSNEICEFLLLPDVGALEDRNSYLLSILKQQFLERLLVLRICDRRRIIVR